ncbi:hypothetical protein SAMN02745127_01840 [Oceanospirillum multiglobuliferum]|nr:hypothetical protein SAMN02745127_01840 [Oceanospirillum multiglobuliferum]
MTTPNTHCVLPSVGAVVSIGGAGLDTQHSRRIRHPQAVSEQGEHNLPNDKFLHTGLKLVRFALFWGDGLGAKRLDREAPRCTFLVRCCLAAANPPFVFKMNKGFHPMIYTFLIAPKGLKLSQLNRVRLVSCYAPTLSVARSAFVGLSLALVSRKPLQHGGRTQ